MTFAAIVILVFMVLEFSNVIAMYFFPGSKYANAVGVFSAWEESRQYPAVHQFVKYLVNWVAGVKLMFLLLLAVILLFGDLNTQKMTLLALALATLSFFWRLFPIIRKMDKDGQIKPKNYSTILGMMIFVFVIFFLLAAM